MQLFYLFEGLRVSPTVAERVVSAVPTESYDHRADPERFSFREAVAHLTDWETVNQERLRKGISEPGCVVQGLNEGQRAIDMGYAAMDPVEQIQVFAERRQQTLSLLKGLTDEDWSKKLVHSERGELTVLELVVMILGHDMYHLEQFTQYMP